MKLIVGGSVINGATPSSYIYILGVLAKTKMKAYTKLTVVMCCQIVARKFVAPSSGDFWAQPAPWYVCGQNQEF